MYAMEWALSGALVTALRQRGDGERIPPLPGGKGGGIEAFLRGLSDRVSD